MCPPLAGNTLKAATHLKEVRASELGLIEARKILEAQLQDKLHQEVVREWITTNKAIAAKKFAECDEQVQNASEHTSLVRVRSVASLPS